MLDAAPTSFLAAIAGLGGNLTALQALINDAMLDHVEDRCVRSGRTAGVIGGATGGGTTGGSSSGASPTVKKSSFGHVLDINLVERVVSNKEGAAAKVRVIAAFYREMTDTRRLWLSQRTSLMWTGSWRNFNGNGNDQWPTVTRCTRSVACRP